MNRLTAVYETSTTFCGRDVLKVWKTERAKWSKQAEASSYDYPILEDSRYESTALPSSKECIDLQSPVICLDLKWSLDGTSLVAVFNDFGVRQYLLPEDRGSELIPFKRFFRSQSIVSSCVHPEYSLFNDSDVCNVMLVSSRDLPIQLFSLSAHAKQHSPLFNYSVMNSENERYETIYAMSFSNNSSFLAGTARNKILAYDLNRKVPVWSSSGYEKKWCRNSVHRSIVSCFDEPNGVADSTVRYMGTYKCDIFAIDTRSGQPELVADRKALGSDAGPAGVTQLLLSANKHFMFVVKRNSNKIEVLDTRFSFTKVNELILPSWIGNQKFKASLDQVNGLLIGTSDGKLAFTMVK